MHAATITPERPWPCTPAPRCSRPPGPRAHPPAGTARLRVGRAARRLLAALDDRMLRDIDLGWDRIERGGAAGRA